VREVGLVREIVLVELETKKMQMNMHLNGHSNTNCPSTNVAHPHGTETEDKYISHPGHWMYFSIYFLFFYIFFFVKVPEEQSCIR